MQGGGGGDSTRGKNIWQLAKQNNRKATIVTRTKVAAEDLRYRNYRGIFFNV